MKSYKKELTELPEECVQRLIAEPIDKDEQIEEIITFNDFSQEEKNFIVDCNELLLDELNFQLDKHDYSEQIKLILEKANYIMRSDRIDYIQFLFKSIITKLHYFSNYVKHERLKELFWPFYNEETGSKKITKKYLIIEPEIFNFSKEAEWYLFKFLYGSSKIERLYYEVLKIIKSISMDVFIGEKKLESVIENDLSKLNNSSLSDEVEDKLERISKEANLLENKIFILKEYRLQLVLLIKALFYVLLGTDKLIESLRKSFNKSIMNWKVETTSAIELTGDFRIENGKITSYESNIFEKKSWIDVSTIALISPDELEKAKDYASKKKEILKANRELEESLLEYVDIGSQKMAQILEFHDRLNNIERLS